MTGIRHAVITDAFIKIDDTGILEAGVTLDYFGDSQVFSCGFYKFGSGIDGKNYAGHFIYRILETAGAHEWKLLKGKAVRVAEGYGHIIAIGNIAVDAWFNPGEEFGLPKREVSA
jgi:hypothetical protein